MEDQPRGPEDKPHRKNSFLKKSGTYLFAAIVAAGVSVTIYAGAQYLYQRIQGNTTAASAVLDNPATAEISENDVQAMKKTSESFRAVAKMVGPAVVLVKATKEVKRRRQPRAGAVESEAKRDVIRSSISSNVLEIPTCSPGLRRNDLRRAWVQVSSSVMMVTS